MRHAQRCVIGTRQHRTPCAFLLVAFFVLACVGLPAVGQAQATTVNLPYLQRGVVDHPNAGLLRLVAQAGFERLGDDCGWEAGVLASGYAKMWERTGDAQYWHLLEAWVDGCLGRAKIAHVNDLPLAYAAVVLHARRPHAGYLALVEEGVDYLFERAPRTQDGTLIHLAGMVWDDTLIVVIPFLLKMWDYTGEARYLDEAVAQVNQHAKHLQDAATGLYHHAWSERAGVYSGPFYWGRGNGWVLLAQAELLVALPSSDARQPALLAQFRRQALPLLARQAPNNLWHTVVTRDDFHVETSATALISAALTTAAVHGLVDDTASAAAAMGRNAVWQQVAATGDLAGIVAGVSGPTGPMDQEAAYGTIPIKEFTLYGQGVVLWMGAAMMPVP